MSHRVRVLSSYIYEGDEGPFSAMGRRNRWFHGFVAGLVHQGSSLNELALEFVRLPNDAAGVEAVHRECLEQQVELVRPDDGAPDSELAARVLDGVPGSSELPGIKNTLKYLGVQFDSWFSEESLHRWGRVSAALAVDTAAASKVPSNSLVNERGIRAALRSRIRSTPLRTRAKSALPASPTR